MPSKYHIFTKETRDKLFLVNLILRYQLSIYVQKYVRPTLNTNYDIDKYALIQNFHWWVHCAKNYVKNIHI